MIAFQVRNPKKDWVNSTHYNLIDDELNVLLYTNYYVCELYDSKGKRRMRYYDDETDSEYYSDFKTKQISIAIWMIIRLIKWIR